MDRAVNVAVRERGGRSYFAFFKMSIQLKNVETSKFEVLYTKHFNIKVASLTFRVSTMKKILKLLQTKIMAILAIQRSLIN